MSPDLVLPQAAAALQPLAVIGGKAAGLAALAQAGAPVPPWICITARVFDEIARCIAGPARPLFDELRHGMPPARLRACAAGLRELVCRTPWPDELEAQLAVACAASFEPGASLAVRSSAIEEDGARHSFAGQLDTFLHVPMAQLAARLRETMASLYADRAVAYRLAHGLDNRGARVAVLVQAMVDSRAAGVVFTANPATGDREEAVVCAGLGLGEGVVDGSVETDLFHAELASGRVLRREIAAKRLAVRRAGEAGTALGPVPASEGDAPALDDAQVAALVALARGVAQQRGAPQDIEWAIDAGGRIVLLQARPITTLRSTRETVFDNANIVESYPGLSLPLTFSFVQENYRDTFREAGRLFGMSKAGLREAEPALANLVALVDGRIYYNIGNWYEMFLRLPGLDRALPAWEKALGLQPRSRAQQPRAARALARLGMGARLAWRFVMLGRDVRRFIGAYEALHAEFESRDLQQLDAHELLELAETLAERIRRPFAVSIVNDFFVQQLHELLTRLIARWHEGPPEPLRNALLCGERGMDSVEPVRSILALADAVRADAAAHALFRAETGELELWQRLQHETRFAALREQLQQHLQRHGDRMLAELKLETPPAAEDPRFLLSMLRNYVAGGQQMAALESREAAIREQAEQMLNAALPAHCEERWLLDFVLRHTRRELAWRENMRLARGRAYGLARRVYRRLGAELARAGVIAEAGDVFYLSTGEVAAAVRGQSLTRDLARLVALRKAEYAALRQAAPPPGRVRLRGIVHGAAGVAGVAETDTDAPTPAGALQGIGCSPGRVKARAKVVCEVGDDVRIDGEILVAPMTDPGWVFLMVAARGLVSERGSPLSHTAIIGRELGVPTIVGVAGATERVRDGAEIEIDGDRGTLRIMDEVATAARPEPVEGIDPISSEAEKVAA